MSSDHDLEQLLRRGRELLPEADPKPTERARERALAAVQRRAPRRLRSVVTVGVLVCAIGLGVGVGALVVPSGTAARPVGLGFLPARGWQVLEAASPAMVGQPRVAMSANVPFAGEDAVLGLANASGLPYSTLLTLPRKGIVVVATFTEPDALFQPPNGAPLYPERNLPFRIRDATPFIQYGTQVRPEEPLGQYQLRASLESWNVDVQVYFGTPRPSSAQLAEAQGQLDRMVVRTANVDAVAEATSTTSTGVPGQGALDRTFSCSPSLVGGVNKVYALASRGSGRRSATWDRPAFAGVRTNVSGTAATAIDNYLVWISSGRPSPQALIGMPWRLELFDFPYRVWGTLAVNRARCRPSAARVSLTDRGLVGGKAGVLPEEYGCTTPKAVLVRVRATTNARTRLTSYRDFVRTVVPASEAVLAVQTPGGKRLAFAEVGAGGSSRILVSQPPCYPD
jgi:hypothetical protein